MRTNQSISIVIPAYNEQRHLRACLDAIAAQTIPVLEALVVDNNSSDETAAIAREYPFVRLLREPRQGIVFARTTGFNAARGTIIARIDADIRLPANWVAHIAEFYADPANRRCTWTGCAHFYNVRFPRLVTWWYAFFSFSFNRFLIGHNTIWGSNMALLRSQWRAVSGSVHLQSDIHEDLDLAMHLHQAGYAIVYDPELRVQARLKRVRSERDKLWPYLRWWPNTLRLHGRRSWVVAWLISAGIFYGGSYAMVVADWLARRLGRPVLPD